ncbi:TetR family transcriptional regulator [Parazoarcus communis]|uniref:TetR family transcriptional regulator n=1 Tax=Parazoarcus communis TaxID=41977 RepID=A0A2U8GRV4_9RHOO|nr:TetR/AcrR family transcriptional regulator [Parazoarcus communis]AWI76407.1 TetR family transcriptional regulator [Parazoarcus communis]
MTEATVARRRGRPPRQEGARDHTREVLMRAGTEILTEHGFASTGIDLVLKRAGVPKGSFYYYFSSKEEFGAAVIAQYANYFARKLDRWLLDEATPPLERLSAFVADAKAGMSRFEFRRGCLIGNLGQELGALNESYRVQLEAVFCDWQQRLAHCFEAAKRCGQLAPDADAAALAEFFWIGWEGAVLRAKLVRNAEPLDRFYRGFLAALPRGA